MKITVVGTGYIGLISGTCLAEAGNDVLRLDVGAKKIRPLKKGLHPEMPLAAPVPSLIGKQLSELT